MIATNCCRFPKISVTIGEQISAIIGTFKRIRPTVKCHLELNVFKSEPVQIVLLKTDQRAMYNHMSATVSTNEEICSRIVITWL